MHQPYTVTAAARKRYDSAMLRRAFLSHVPAAATVLGVVQSPETQAAAPASRVDSARHPQGAWFDELPARHRAVFDTWLADHFSEAVSRMLAEEGGGDADTVYKELTANTLGSAHFVPAGIVAVTRAQERGFSLVCVG
jgi:hypothetical protein